MEIRLLPLPDPELRRRIRWHDDWYEQARNNLADCNHAIPAVRERLKVLDAAIYATFQLCFEHPVQVTPPNGAIYLIACCVQRDYYIKALLGEEEDFETDAETKRTAQDDEELYGTGLDEGEVSWDEVIRVDAALERHRKLIERL